MHVFFASEVSPELFTALKRIILTSLKRIKNVTERRILNNRVERRVFLALLVDAYAEIRTRIPYLQTDVLERLVNHILSLVEKQHRDRYRGELV